MPLSVSQYFEWKLSDGFDERVCRKLGVFDRKRDDANLTAIFAAMEVWPDNLASPAYPNQLHCVY